MKITEAGVYELTPEEYHSDPVIDPSLSRSTIKDLLFKSPAHAKHKHPRLNPDFKEEESGKFDIGTAGHFLLLEGEDSIAIIEADDWRTKAAKEERDEARKSGMTPLLRHQFDSAKTMVTEAHLAIMGCKELEISTLKDCGKAEQSYIWKEDKTWLRVRPDWVSNDNSLMIDYKTTEASANPEDYVRIALSTALDIQQALYTRGVKAIEGTEPKFVLVVQESYEPFLCSFIAFTPQFMEMGQQKVELGIFQWNQCMSKNEWPGYPNRLCYLEAPAWALAQWESIGEKIGI